MTNQNYLKAAVVGLIGSLAMFILIQLAISAGMAPFNVPPSAAFLISLGLPAKPLALIVHFLYGAFWSVILVAVAKENAGIKQGLILSLAVWLIMMLVMSPIIGWGVFGGATAEVSQDAKLYLAPGPKYPIATLVIHLVYGLVIGGLNKSWSLKVRQQESTA
jgi:hypothetical protein